MVAFGHSFVSAARNTINVVGLRWATVRSFRIKVAFAIALYAMVLFFGFTLNTGHLFAELATFYQLEQAVIARAWIEDLAAGDLMLLSISFIATGVGIVALAPFTGASTLTLIDDDSASPYGFTRGRRFFDAVFFSSISAVGIVHLLVATLTASIIGLQGERFWSILLACFWWFLFLTLAAANGLAVDILSGYFGRLTKWLYGAGVASLAFVVYSVPSVQEFALSMATAYGHSLAFMAQAAVGGKTIAVVASLVVLSSVSAWGFWLARHWDSLPAERKVVRRQGRKGPIKIKNKIGLDKFVLVTLWRTREVRRTLIAVTFVGALSATYFFPTAPDSLIAGIAVGIPAVSAMIWLANGYGIFGAGLTWMTAQPGVKARLPLLMAQFNITQSLVMGLVFTLPIAILYWETFSSYWEPFAIALPLNILITTAIALYVATLRPYIVRLTGRGESILPPSASISYLLGLGTVSSANFFAVSVFLRDNSVLSLALYTVGIFIAAIALFSSSSRAWNQPDSMKKLLSVASGD